MEAVQRYRGTEAGKANFQRYQDSIREKKRITARNWALANPKRMRELHRNFIKLHPEKARTDNHARRARLLNAKGTHTAKDVQDQYDGQKGRCWWCNRKLKKFEVDHRIPLARGGGNGPDNIVISCPNCNHRKSDKLPSEFAGRLL